MESPTIVPLIHRLVALGLVERITTASDKRKRLLVVTDKGKVLYEQVKTVADDLREEILTAITPTGAGANPAGAGKAVARSGEEIMPRRQDNPYAPHDWAPHEKPALLGSPSTPLHWSGETPCLRRGRSAGMSPPARWATQWSPPTCGCCRVPSPPGRQKSPGCRRYHVMTNVSINLLLVKFRQQFGLRAFTEGFLVLYVLVTFFHLFVNDLSSAMMVRAAHGMVAPRRSALWGFTTRYRPGLRAIA